MNTPAEARPEPQLESAAAPAAAPAAATGGGHRWTFLTNHAHVLVTLHAQPDMVLREVAQVVGITERAVQRIVMELEEGGYIAREKVGRQNHYRVRSDIPLRHPIEAHRNIGDLLALIVEPGTPRLDE